MRKSIVRISYVLMALLFGLFGLFYLIFNSGRVQTYIAGKASEYLSGLLKTEVRIGNLYYDGWTYFRLENIFVADHKADTLFFVGKLRFDLSGMDLDSMRVVLDDIHVDQGLCKLTTYPDSTSSLDVLTSLAGNDTTPTTNPFRLYLHEVRAENSRFVFIDSTTNVNEPGFHYGNMQFYESSLRIRHFNLIGDSLHFQIKQLKARERSGLEIVDLTTVATIAPSIMEFAKLEVETPYSHVGNYFAMRYDGWDGIGADFMKQVKLEAHIRNSHVHMNDVQRFAYGYLNDFHYDPSVQVDVSGTVANLKIKNAAVRYGKNTVFRGDCKINGLPDIDQTYFDLETYEASTDPKELEDITAVKLPAILHRKLGKVTYSGKYNGFISDFVSFGKIETQYGSIETDLNMKIPFDKPMNASYSGFVSTSNFLIGALLEQSDLGSVQLDCHIDGQGFNPENAVVKSKIHVAYVDYKQYRYSDLQLNTGIDHLKLQGRFESNDPHAQLSLKGFTNLGISIPEYRFVCDIGQIDLHPLHFSNRDISFSTQMQADFSMKDVDHNHGSLEAENSLITIQDRDYTINRIEFVSMKHGSNKELSLESDFLNASLSGSFELKSLPDLFRMYLNKLAPAYFPEVHIAMPTEQFKFQAKLKNTYVLTPLFFPDIELSKAEIRAGLDDHEGDLDIRGYAEMLRFQNVYLNELTIKSVLNDARESSILLGVSRFMKNDSLLMKDFACKAELANNKARIRILLSDSVGMLHADWMNRIEFMPGKIQIGFDKSYVRFMDTKWKVDPQSQVIYSDSNLRFIGFQLNNGLQLLDLNGFYSLIHAQQNLTITLTNFSLSNLNVFGVLPKVKLNGDANGNVILGNENGRTTVNSNLQLNDLQFDSDTIGDMRISSNFDQSHKRLSFEALSLNGKLNNFQAFGYVWFNETQDLDIRIGFDEARVDAFNAFGKEYFSLLDGTASLKATLSGTVQKPVFKGEMELHQVKSRIEYLKTVYHADAKLLLSDNAIQIQPTQVFDVNNKSANLTGTIYHEHFNKFRFDILIDGFRNFQMLNTTAKDNDLYYGKAYGSGRVSIQGPLSDIVLDVQAKSEKGTSIILTPFGSSDSEEDKLLHILSYDSTQQIKQNDMNDLSGFTIRMMTQVTPDAEIQIVFDDQSDDRMRAIGTGDLKMQLDRTGEFNMYGNVALIQGDYKFSAMNLVSRKFDLQSGSSISWNGDPFQARMDITGIYRTRSSINELVNLSSQTGTTQRMQVECLMNIRGSFESPAYSFDLNFPETETQLNGTSANEFNAMLGNLRKDPDNMTQQVISLLVFGKFTPLANVTSSGNPGTNFSSKALSDLASGQINAILGKVAPGIDFSIDMQNAIDPTKGRSLLLSASHKFFDNRLELQGTVATDNSQNNFIAQYNISRNGNFKARLFNRYALNPIYDKNITTQGMGLYYRKEFNRFFK